MPNITRFNAQGDEIKPGLRQRHPTNFDSIRFDFYVVLDSETPDLWHGEVMLRGKEVLRTDQFQNESMAGKAAEDALLERLLVVMSD